MRITKPQLTCQGQAYKGCEKVLDFIQIVNVLAES